MNQTHETENYRNKILYLDHHATTPVDALVLEEMLPYFQDHFGNAESSQHPYGWKAKAAVENARGQVATLLGAESREIIFTSGATESIHLAILGLLENQTETLLSSLSRTTLPSNCSNATRPSGRAHMITSNAEHKCVLEVASRVEKLGHEVTILPVDHFGRVSLGQIQNAIRPNTTLVSLIHGNNEIGTLTDIAKIGSLLRSRGILFHVDAAQTVGKHEIKVADWCIDLLSLSAHKLYGPKGIGALYARRGGPGAFFLSPYLVGGGQERGLRGGTHNVPGIVGLGKACEMALNLMPTETARLTQLRDHFITSLLDNVSGVRLNGHPTERLCNNVNVTFSDIESDTLLLGLRGIAYSSASACSAGATSHVLEAIGQKQNSPAQATLRFGLGRTTTKADVDWTIDQIVKVTSKVQFDKTHNI
jgi:cysteine desulfurase